MFGHWLECHAEATEDAHRRLRAPLTDHLGRWWQLARASQGVGDVSYVTAARLLLRLQFRPCWWSAAAWPLPSATSV